MTSNRTQSTSSRARILRAAAELFHQQGVHGTSVDEILARSKTGKSQFYHFFSSKDQVVAAVLQHHFEEFSTHADKLRQIDRLDDFIAWWTRQLETTTEHPFCGCPIGALANELSLNHQEIQRQAQYIFRMWTAALARCLAVIQSQGDLTPEANPDELAQFFVACYQGASLLAKTESDRELFQRALRPAHHCLEAFRTAHGATTSNK